MAEINFYYLEKPTLSNLKRIFNSGDIPFIRLSKFLDPVPRMSKPEFNRREKIGYYNRQEASAFLMTFGNHLNSSSFLKPLRD